MKIDEFGMKRSRLGRFVPDKMGRLQRLLFQSIVAREGGEMTSLTLRSFLQTSFGVTVGIHAYGSLLQPGNADKLTFIGPYVSVGPGVRRIGAAHPITKPSLHPYWYNESLGYVSGKNVARVRCDIEADTWIGANALILPGCRRIGFGSVIGAGSVVTHDVPDFAIVAGNPARILRYRLNSKLREELADAELWQSDPDHLQVKLEALYLRFG